MISENQVPKKNKFIKNLKKEVKVTKFNAENFRMSISEMFKYREILEKKRDDARMSGRQEQLTSTLMRIDFIDMMLDAALMATIGEAQPFLLKVIDSSMFDASALKTIMEPSRLKALPVQGSLNFEIVEEAHVVNQDEELKNAMKEILRRNFVQEIPRAVEKYRELTGSKEPDAKVWIKIKEMMTDNSLIGGWDRILCNNVIEKGSIFTFCQVKKHMKNWKDIDIAILINDAVEKACRQQASEKEAKEKLERSMGVLELSPQNAKDYIEDGLSVPVLIGCEGIDSKMAARRIHQIANILSPSKRSEIIKRKEYVERGY